MHQACCFVIHYILNFLNASLQMYKQELTAVKFMKQMIKTNLLRQLLYQRGKKKKFNNQKELDSLRSKSSFT